MTGWIKTSLGELCDITMGQSPPSNTYNTKKNGLPFFQGKAEFTDLYPAPQKWCIKPQKRADEGDILVSVRAPVGDVNIADQYCCIGRGLAAIKYDNSPRFIFYFLKHSKGELEKLSTGTTFKAISKQTILNYSLFIPSLIEQHQIVFKIEELFSELDNGVESLKKAREQLKTYRQAVLKYAFEGKLTHEWREQHLPAGRLEPAEKLLERIKKERDTQYQKHLEEWQKACEQAETDGSKKPAKPRKPKDLPPLTEKELAELPELPEGWRWIKLGEILFSITAGKSFKCKEVPPKNDEIGVAKVSAVTWGEYKEIESKTCEDPTRLHTEYLIKEGDFLFSRANTIELVGASVIVKKITLNVMLSDKTLRFTFKIANKLFILYYLRSMQGRSEIERLATGNQESMRNIGQDRIKQIILPFMSVEEQQAIVSEIETRLSVCDQLEKTIEDSLKKAEALRQSILKKAFDGELTREWRAAHPELISGENSAESLLARIREEKARLKGIER